VIVFQLMVISTPSWIASMRPVGQTGAAKPEESIGVLPALPQFSPVFNHFRSHSKGFDG
jgi:hypothetical protein